MKLLVTAIAIAALALPARAQPQPGGAAAKHVILVTIDGMRGDYIARGDPYHLKIPTMRGLIREGASGERTLSVFPTLTGTAHTALVTGVGAARHGILGNNRFDPSVWVWGRDNYDAQPPYRDFSDIRAETIWAAARSRKMATAAINWPQTAGGPIDFRVDVAVGATADEAYTRTSRSAGTWLDHLEPRFGRIAALDTRMADHYKALIAGEILHRFKPAFMALHLSHTDAVQHALGPGTAEALVAVEEADANLGIIVDAIRRYALASDVAIIVTGDHGFLPMHTELAINLPLVEGGLIKRGRDQRPEWDVIIAPNRGLGSVYVRDGLDQAALSARARQLLGAYAARYPGRFRILERAELDRWGADGRAVFGIEPLPGYVLDARLAPPFAQPHNRAAGHGYAPDTPGMETGLIMAGAGVRRGVVLAETRTIDIAPTIARLLGFELTQAEGQPIAGALK